jgi:amino acid transporter
MTANFAWPILLIAVVIVIPLAVSVLAIPRLRASSATSRTKKMLWGGSLGISLLPILGVGFLILWYVVANFPFTSGIVARASAPSGEEACVVQTFKGTEPYQVSLYARRPGQPWAWHYLAHQDNRWGSCRLEFTGDELRVYADSKLRKTFSLAEATAIPKDPRDQLPANYTPEQILAQHNKFFRQ